MGDVEGLHNARDAFMFTIQPRAALVALSGTCIYWHLHYIQIRQDQNIIVHAVICIVNHQMFTRILTCLGLAPRGQISFSLNIGTYSGF